MSTEDLVRDPRFADASDATPVVTAEQLRFFAGTPLKVAGGVVVGTLCLYDRAPRSLGDDELALLAKMARELVAPLDAKAAEARRPTSRIKSRARAPLKADPARS